MDSRLMFEVKCPYCGRVEGWLFEANDNRLHIVRCDECGQMYVIKTSLQPVVDAVFEMVQVVNEAE